MNATTKQKFQAIGDLLSDLPRGRCADYVGLPSNAHFESSDNLLATESLRFDAANNHEGKLFLGVIDGETVTGPRLPDGRLSRWVTGGTPIGIGDDRHILTVAGSRAGKGRAALIPNLILLPATTSTLVIDPKGDLARYTARWRADGLRQQVGVIDPFDCSGIRTQPYRVAFNPIDILLRSDHKTFVPNAKLIADSLIVMGDFKDRHWDATAKQICAGLCAHIATHTNYSGRRDLITLWQLAAELATPDPHDPQQYWLEQEMLANDAAAGMVRAAARNFYNRSGGEFSSVLSNLTKHLDWISIECMQDVLRGNSVDLRDLKRKSLSLYVTIPAMRLADLSGWLRLIVQMSLAACEEETVSFGNATLFILDEFFALGKMSALEGAIAQLAGLQARLWVVLQDLNQLKQNYSKNYETFIGNAGVLQFFGGSDETTLSYVSKLLGQSLTFTHSTNMPTFDQAAKQAATGESWAMANHPLLTAEELGRYVARDDKKLRQLVLRPGYHPMILQRVFYDKHKLFHGKYDEE